MKKLVSMRRYGFALVLGLLLMAGSAEAVEEKHLCWRDVCAGMTLPEVRVRLEELGFDVHDNWLFRWFQRLQPQIGGVFEHERYIEGFSATRDNKCEPFPTLRKPCSSVELEFVRFPSGRRRLLSLNSEEALLTGRLASEIIADLKTVLGPPELAEWQKFPDSRDVEAQWTWWFAHWRNKHLRSDWVSARIKILEEANIEAGALSPLDLEETVHADWVQFSFNALWMVGREVERAWTGEKAGWIADQRTGCRVWNTFPRDSDTISWDGPCENGYASGFGVVRWSSRFRGEYEINEGEFRGGRLNGHAIITAGSYLRFEGEFRNHLPDGQGTLEESGEIYSGNWSNGCFSQEGKRTAFFTHRDQCEKY